MAPIPVSVAQIPLEKIQMGSQVREDFDADALQRLAEDIRRNGLLQPVCLIREGEGFRLIAGERRCRALQSLGQRTILATIWEGTLPDQEIIAKMLSENVNREDLNPIELARGLRQLKELSGETASAVATRMGMSDRMVSDSLALLELDPEIQEAIKLRKIPPSVAAELARVTDPALQKELTQQVLTRGLTREGVVARRKEPRRTPVPGAAGKKQRVTATLGHGESLTVVGSELDLDRFITLLEGLLSRARRARPRGLELKTFLKVLKEESLTASP